MAVCADQIQFNSLTLTVSELYRNVSKTKDKEFLEHFKKVMQNGIFKMLWDKCRAHKPENLEYTTVYSTVGAMTEAIFKDTCFTDLRERLKNEPITGIIKSKLIYADNLKFIVFVRKGFVILIFDNAAFDSKIAQVQVWDSELESFIPHTNSNLMDFYTINGIVLN